MIKEHGSIQMVPTKTLIISTCNGSRTENLSFSSPKHKNLNLPPCVSCLSLLERNAEIRSISFLCFQVK